MPVSAGSGTSVRRPCAGNGMLEHGKHLPGCAHALRAGVILSAEQSEREVCLRSEHEHHQRGAQVEVPAHQPQADLDGDECH